MSSAGPFTIISNDGKQDKLLMASQLLEARLAEISARKRKMGYSPDDPESLPTLMDIEQTHILYTAAYYKPFAAIGFSYNINTASQGVPNFGSTITFSIQQYGDFFHDMAVHMIVRQPTVTFYGAGLTANLPLVAWCDYPGERMLKGVKFSVNGSDLDKYTRNQVVFHRQLFVSTDKQLSWDRCVGQQETYQAKVDKDTRGWAQSLTTINGGDNSSINGQNSVAYTNGLQTPHVSTSALTDQTTNPKLNMFIPLLFWFNQSVRLAIPSAAIPYGQRFVELELASGTEIVSLIPRNASAAATTAFNGSSLDFTTTCIESCKLYVNNIFVLPEIHNIYIKRISFTLVRVHLLNIQEVATATNSIHLVSLKWPIEYLMAGLRPKIYETISIATSYLYFSKWSLYSLFTDTTVTTGESKLVKRSLGTVTVDVDGDAGLVTFGAALTFDMPAGTLIQISGEQSAVTIAAYVAGATTVVVAPDYLVDINAVASSGYMYIDNTMVTQIPSRTVDTFGIVSHNIDLYNPAYESRFYNSYLTYHYGKDSIRSPRDIGILLVPFCLFPGSYQPSGHVNVSRTREFYANYSSSYCAADTPCVLYVAASAINFLLIADGSAVMRFNT